MATDQFDEDARNSPSPSMPRLEAVRSLSESWTGDGADAQPLPDLTKQTGTDVPCETGRPSVSSPEMPVIERQVPCINSDKPGVSQPKPIIISPLTEQPAKFVVTATGLKKAGEVEKLGLQPSTPGAESEVGAGSKQKVMDVIPLGHVVVTQPPPKRKGPVAKKSFPDRSKKYKAAMNPSVHPSKGESLDSTTVASQGVGNLNGSGSRNENGNHEEPMQTGGACFEGAQNGRGGANAGSADIQTKESEKRRSFVCPPSRRRRKQAAPSYLGHAIGAQYDSPSQSEDPGDEVEAMLGYPGDLDTENSHRVQNYGMSDEGYMYAKGGPQEKSVFGLTKMKARRNPAGLIETYKVFYCNFCLTKTEDEQAFMRHAAAHLFVCNVCPYQSFVRVNMVNHIIRQHPDRGESLQTLNSMLLEHTPSKAKATNVLDGFEPIDLSRYKQPVSSSSSSSRQQSPDVHSDSPSSSQTPRLTDNGATQCQHCYFKNSDRQVVKEHAAAHQGICLHTIVEFEAACPVCSLGLSSLKMLQIHLRHYHPQAGNKLMYGMGRKSGMYWFCPLCNYVKSDRYRYLVTGHVQAHHGDEDMLQPGLWVGHNHYPAYLAFIWKRGFGFTNKVKVEFTAKLDSPVSSDSEESEPKSNKTKSREDPQGSLVTLPKQNTKSSKPDDLPEVLNLPQPIDLTNLVASATSSPMALSLGSSPGSFIESSENGSISTSVSPSGRLIGRVSGSASPKQGVRVKQGQHIKQKFGIPGSPFKPAQISQILQGQAITMDGTMIKDEPKSDDDEEDFMQEIQQELDTRRPSSPHRAKSNVPIASSLPKGTNVKDLLRRAKIVVNNNVPDDMKIEPRLHLEVLTDPPGVMCKICEAMFTSKNSMSHATEHVYSHFGIKTWECPYCGEQRNRRLQIISHVALHTDKPLVVIRLKPYTTSALKGQVTMSNNNASATKSIVPEIHMEGYLSSGMLDGSLSSLKSDSSPPKPDRAEKVWVCPYCTRQDPQKSLMLRHLKYVHPEKDSNPDVLRCQTMVIQRLARREIDEDDEEDESEEEDDTEEQESQTPQQKSKTIKARSKPSKTSSSGLDLSKAKVEQKERKPPQIPVKTEPEVPLSSPDGKYRCHYCDYHGKRLQDTQLHLRKEHPKEELIVNDQRISKQTMMDGEEGRIMYLCPGCEFNSYVRDALHVHAGRFPAHFPNTAVAEETPTRVLRGRRSTDAGPTDADAPPSKRARVDSTSEQTVPANPSSLEENSFQDNTGVTTDDASIKASDDTQQCVDKTEDKTIPETNDKTQNNNSEVAPKQAALREQTAEPAETDKTSAGKSILDKEKTKSDKEKTKPGKEKAKPEKEKAKPEKEKTKSKSDKQGDKIRDSDTNAEKDTNSKPVIVTNGQKERITSLKPTSVESPSNNSKTAANTKTPKKPESGGTPKKPVSGGTPKKPESGGTPKKAESRGTPKKPESGGTPKKAASPAAKKKKTPVRAQQITVLHCPHCANVCRYSTDAMRRHLTEKHPQEEVAAIDVKGSLVYLCKHPTCDTMSDQASSLELHLKQAHAADETTGSSQKDTGETSTKLAPLSINTKLQSSDSTVDDPDKPAAKSPSKSSAVLHIQKALKKVQKQKEAKTKPKSPSTSTWPSREYKGVDTVLSRYHCRYCDWKNNSDSEACDHLRKEHPSETQEIKDQRNYTLRKKSRLHFCQHKHCGFRTYEPPEYTVHACWRKQEDGMLVCLSCEFMTEEEVVIMAHAEEHMKQIPQKPPAPRPRSRNSGRFKPKDQSDDGD